MNTNNTIQEKTYIVGYVDNSSYEIPYLILVTNPAEYNTLFNNYMPPMPVLNRFTRFFIVPSSDIWKLLLKSKQYDFKSHQGLFDDFDTSDNIWEPDYSIFSPYVMEYEVGEDVYEIESYLNINILEEINLKQILTGNKFKFPHKDINRALYNSGEFQFLPVLNSNIKFDL